MCVCEGAVILWFDGNNKVVYLVFRVFQQALCFKVTLHVVGVLNYAVICLIMSNDELSSWKVLVRIRHWLGKPNDFRFSSKTSKCAILSTVLIILSHTFWYKGFYVISSHMNNWFFAEQLGGWFNFNILKYLAYSMKLEHGNLLLQVNLYVGNTQSPWQTFIF